MKKLTSIHFKNFDLLAIISALILCVSCQDSDKKSQALNQSGQLLNNISSGSASKYFPEKYFPKDQAVLILSELNDKCDFKSRKGHFVNDFYTKSNYVDRISFIYEYYLKCDSIRFILTYNLGEKVELFEFNLEPIEKYNKMILKPERRLSY